MNRVRRRSLTLGLPVLCACVLSFQNCQDFRMSDQFLQSQAAYEMDQAVLGSLAAAPEFVGAYQAGTGTGTGVNSGSAAPSVSSLPNAADASLLAVSKLDLSLVTPASAPVLALNPATGASLLTHVVPAAGGGAPILTTSSQDNLLATSFSVAIVLRKPLAHDILSINGGGRGSEDLSIVVENGMISARHYSDAANYTSVSLPLPAQDDVVVAASFEKDAAKVILTVNGISSSDVTSVFPADATGKMIGAGPSDLSFVLRQFQLGATQAGGQVSWGESRLFVKALSRYELNVLSRDLASRWGVPNVADDPAARDATTGGTAASASPEFLAAYSVLQGNCFGCHTEWIGKKSAQFVSLGLVVPGAPGSSPIYQRLSGVGGEQMPKGQAALAADQVQKIAAWINSAH